MKPEENRPATIDEYIRAFRPEVQTLLGAMRQAIREAAPEATEAISYQIPTFKLNGNLVHFAAFKHHIGFYPGAGGIQAFEQELSAYKGAKGSVQFPFNQSLPLDLVKRIVAFRVRQNQPDEFTGLLAAPARRALAGIGITTLAQLAALGEDEALALHGMGKNAITKLKQALALKGLSFKAK